jgi:membrane protease YdiL (CAAX protease family)
MKDVKYRPITFFSLAFGITWICGFVMAAQVRNGGEKNLILLLLAYLGPYFAALLVMFFFHDREFRADFRKRIYSLKLIRAKYVPLVLFIMPVGLVLSILISILFGQPVEQLRLAEEFNVLDGEIILSMIILLLVPFLEELGWRGYGVDSLLDRFNLFTGSLIFGFLWGLWHLPVFFIPNSYQASLWQQNPIFAINFFVGIIPLAIIANYIYVKNNRSILLIIVFHWMVNYSLEILQPNQISKCIFTLVLFAIAAFITVRDRDFLFKSEVLHIAA